MKSNIVKELNCNFKPIVFLKTDSKPENAIEMREGSYGCLMSKIALVIQKRKTFVVSKETCSCAGAFPGLGFGTRFENDKDIANHAAFLSLGYKCALDKESFNEYLDNKPAARREFFEKGEHVFDNFDKAYKYVQNWSSRIIDGKYAVFKPLEELEECEIPISVIFTLTPLELSPLLILNASIREVGNSNIIVNQAAACHAISWEVYNQDKDDLNPVLGLVDLEGRKRVRTVIGDNYFNLSLPWELYLKLEEASKDSILQSSAWRDMK